MKDSNRFLFPAYAVTLVLVSALLIGAVLLRAGRTGTGWTRRPNEIIFTGWGGPEEKAVFTHMVAQFEKENPGVHVRYIVIPQNYMQKLQIMMAGGTPPDVFYIPDGDFPGFVVKQTMIPLTDYVRRSKVIHEPEFWPSALNRYRYNGRRLGTGTLYALPKDIGPFAMYYNRKLFRKAGLPYPSATVPMTWDEAIPIWKKLTIPNPRNPAFPDQFGVANFPLEAAVWSAGGEFVSPDGRRFTADQDPRTVEAVQWVANLAVKEKCAPSPRQVRSMDPGPMFDTGKLACIFSGRWMVPHYRTLSFDWDVAPIPVHPRTRKLAGWSGSVGLAIARTCPNKDLAWKFIEYLSGPRGQAEQSLQGFQIPNQMALARTDVFLQRDQRPAHAEVFIPAALAQRPGLATVAPTTEWLDEMWQRMNPVWQGDTTAAEGLRRIHPYAQKGLDNAWQQDQ